MTSWMEGPREVRPKPLLAAARLWRVAAAFETKLVAREFGDWRAKLSAPQRRAGLYFALIAWVATVGFDLFDDTSTPLSRPVSIAVLAMRGGGALALLAAIFASTRERFETFVFSEVLIGLVSGALQLLLITMATEVDLPYDFVADNPGPILLMFAVVGLFAIAARTFLIILLVAIPYNILRLYGATAASVRLEHPLAPARLGQTLVDFDFIRTAAYVLMAALIAYLINAQLERGAREAFARERRLSRANTDLETARLDSEAKAAALIAAKEELRATAERESATKSRFLAEAAHDLSQPFQALSMLLAAAGQAIQDADLSGARRIIADAARAAALARAFFASILQLSSLESGLVAPRIEAFDLVALVADVIAPFAVEAATRGVTLRIRAPPGGAVLVDTDHTMMARVLANLVSNAVRCADTAKAKPFVVVGVVRLGDRARLEVFDNGVGISEARQADIFRPLRQLRHARMGETSGLGLGLSIVRAILRQLPRHDLRLASTEGRYTRFSVLLPLATPRPEAAD